MHAALNKIYINALIEIAFNVSKNRLEASPQCEEYLLLDSYTSYSRHSFPNACVNANALDRIKVR